MQSETTKNSNPKESEIDLGVFFNLLSRLFSSVVNAVKSFFLFVFHTILSILIFIKRRIIWLAAGLFLGLITGLYFYFKEGPVYYSDMVVRANFENARSLYNAIDYFNSLVKDGKTNELVQVFSISETDANKLIRFEISAIDDELERIKLYKAFISDYNRNNLVKDTSWAKMIKYSDFKNDLTAYNFPLQKIRVYSNNPDVYRSIQSGLVKSFQQYKDLLELQGKFISVLKDEETILQRSLTGLDSLRVAYNKSIFEGTRNAEGSNVVLGNNNKNFSSPEIELYDKELLLKDEITEIKNKLIEQQNVFRVTAAFNESGTKVSGYDQEFIMYAWYGLLLSFCVLLLIECNRYLDKIDKEKRSKL